MKADMFRLDGKVVAVIGAGGGIGACGGDGAWAAGRAHRVLDLKADTAEATAAAIRAAGGAAESAVLDITDERRRRRRRSTAWRRTHGHLDGLVCTPAINVRKPIAEVHAARSSTASWP